MFKNCAPLTDAQKVDMVIPMYNLIEYSDAYSTLGSLWQYPS